MAPNRLLTVSLNILRTCGMNPYDNDTISKIKRFVFIAANLLSYVDFVLICIFDWKGFDSIAEITIYISFMHVGYKMTSLMVKQRRYLDIFQSMDKFTKWEDLEGHIKEDVDKTVNTFLKMIHGFQIVVVTAGFGYSCSPLLVTSRRQTPLETHFSKYFDNTFVYLSIYIVHAFDFFLEVIAVLGHDTLYISLISSINIEIRIIKDRIQKLMVGDADGDRVDKMSQIVAQHNLILKVIKQCNLVYADVLLVQFLSSIIFLATVLACLMDSGFPPPMGSVLTFGMHLSASMFQLFIFCTLGQILINQTKSISDAVYNIKWWVKPLPKLRQACMLMIQRSHKLDCLSAAGMFIVNYESYTKVLKFGLSLFSLTQAMKARNEHLNV